MAKTKLSTYILLDRSASMAGARWENAIGSINAYVEELKKNKDIAGEVTVAAFDGEHRYPTTLHNNGIAYRGSYMQEEAYSNVKFDVLRDKQSLSKFQPLSMTETSPRGNTPLYDATGLLLNMAESKPNEKTIILIMTDGEENQSKVYNLQSIKDRLACCTNRGWEVVFLGAEFNVNNIASSFGISGTKTLSTVRSADLNETMAFYASAGAQYATMGAAIDTTSMKAKVEK